MRFTSSLLALVASLLGCGGVAPSPGAPASTEPVADAPAQPSEPFTVDLAAYRAGLRSVQVEVGGESRRLLFDTGAGITAVSPAVAEAIGCEPYGRLTGHRQTDERLDMPLCPEVTLTIGGRPLALAPAGVFDVDALLPEDWPRVDGVVGLNAFAGRVVALDLGCGELEVDAAVPTNAEPVRVRVARETEGVGLAVYAAVDTTRPDASAWFLLDSGNTGPVLVAEHIAELLAVEGEGAHRLDFSGFGSRETPVAVMDLIHDGNIGAAFLAEHRLYLNLAAGTAAVTPSGCQDS
jgi:hypothetical protein